MYCFILEKHGRYFKTWSARLRRKAKSEGYDLVATIKCRDSKDISVFGKKLSFLPHSIKSMPDADPSNLFAIFGHGRSKVEGRF